MGERDYYKESKLQAIFKLIHDTEGKAKAEEVDRAGKNAVKKAMDEIGEESENRFTIFAERMAMVEHVRESSAEEDIYGGIDKWILFKPELKLPELPVQIKSSYRQTILFMYGDQKKGILPDPSFSKLHGMMMVMNCGPSVEEGYFKRQIRSEIQRIKQTLKVNPHLSKHLK